MPAAAAFAGLGRLLAVDELADDGGHLGRLGMLQRHEFDLDRRGPVVQQGQNLADPLHHPGVIADDDLLLPRHGLRAAAGRGEGRADGLDGAGRVGVLEREDLHHDRADVGVAFRRRGLATAARFWACTICFQPGCSVSIRASCFIRSALCSTPSRADSGTSTGTRMMTFLLSSCSS